MEKEKKKSDNYELYKMNAVQEVDKYVTVATGIWWRSIWA